MKKLVVRKNHNLLIVSTLILLICFSLSICCNYTVAKAAPIKPTTDIVYNAGSNWAVTNQEKVNNLTLQSCEGHIYYAAHKNVQNNSKLHLGLFGSFDFSSFSNLKFNFATSTFWGTGDVTIKFYAEHDELCEHPLATVVGKSGVNQHHEVTLNIDDIKNPQTNLVRGWNYTISFQQNEGTKMQLYYENISAKLPTKITDGQSFAFGKEGNIQIEPNQENPNTSIEFGQDGGNLMQLGKGTPFTNVSIRYPSNEYLIQINMKKEYVVSNPMSTNACIDLMVSNFSGDGEGIVEVYSPTDNQFLSPVASAIGPRGANSNLKLIVRGEDIIDNGIFNSINLKLKWTNKKTEGMQGKRIQFWFAKLSFDEINVDKINFISKGASMRVTQPSGLRFTFALDKEIFNQLVEIYGVDNVEVGALLIPQKLLDSPTDNITLDTPNVAKKVCEVWCMDEKNEKKFNTVLINIPTQDYSTEVSAVAYIKVSYGQTPMIYYSEKITRSVSFVAQKAYEDVDSEFYQSPTLEPFFNGGNNI